MKSKNDKWAFFEWFYIPDAENPSITYLKRLRVVQTPFASMYIHWIYRPDGDRDLHSHPWNMISCILRGGYSEVLTDPEGNNKHSRTHKRFSAHYHPMSLFHRIEVLKKDTVTLVFVGKRKTSWGFLTENGFVHWEEYIAKKYGK